MHYGKVGTREYWSPELKNGSGYTTQTDMFSLGLTFLEVVKREEYEFNVGQLASKLIKLESSKKRCLHLEEIVVHDTFAIWVNVINQLVDPDQTKRISCPELGVALSGVKY